MDSVYIRATNVDYCFRHRGALQVRAATAEGVPLACPVALKELDVSGKCASSGLTYKPDSTRIWDLTIGAAEGLDTRKVPANVQVSLGSQ